MEVKKQTESSSNQVAAGSGSGNSFRESQLYKILSWESKLHSALALLAVNLFFVFYVILDNSLLNLGCKAGLIWIAYKLILTVIKKNTDDGEYNYEILSEEAVKELYVVLYVLLNNTVQYFRDIIQLKDQKRSLVVSAPPCPPYTLIITQLEP